MSSQKKNITTFFKKRNAKRFSIFMLIAFVFLIFSKLSNDYKQSFNLKIEINNIADEVILQRDSINTIKVYAEAKGFALVPFIFKDYKTIQLDAEADVITNANQFVFDVQKHKYLIEDQVGVSFKILSVKPDTLFIPYSKRASRMVPIQLNSNIVFEDGYDIMNDYKLSMDSIKIVGPNDVINEIDVIKTKEIVLSNIKSDISENVEFNILDGVEYFPNSVNITAEVKRFTEGTIDVPVTVINQPTNSDINYFPKTVSVSYYVDLENYNSINATDFKVECDFNDINGNQSFLVPKMIEKPSFVKRIHIKQKRIDFIIL